MINSIKTLSDSQLYEELMAEVQDFIDLFYNEEPCFERTCIPTNHGDNYRIVVYDKEFNLLSPEGREKWKEAAKHGNRIIPEDGAAYVQAIEHFVIEPCAEYILNDGLPHMLERLTDDKGSAERIRKEYQAGKAERIENSKLLPRESKREKRLSLKWAKLNKAIGNVLKSHPEGLTCPELYAELAHTGAADVSLDTFRKYLKDNRCEYEVEKAGPFNVVAKSL